MLSFSLMLRNPSSIWKEEDIKCPLYYAKYLSKSTKKKSVSFLGIYLDDLNTIVIASAIEVEVAKLELFIDKIVITFARKILESQVIKFLEAINKRTVDFSLSLEEELINSLFLM